MGRLRLERQGYNLILDKVRLEAQERQLEHTSVHHFVVESFFQI